MVTFTHECPGNPPHLLFKSMQITASKSSRASSEAELCTRGDWTADGGGDGGGGGVYSLSPHASSTMFMSRFSSKDPTCSFKLVQFGSVKQTRDSEGVGGYRAYDPRGSLSGRV